MLLGVVLFDDPRAPGAGWMSCRAVHGATAERIAGIGDVPTDLVWVTNVEQGDFYALRLHRDAHLRRANYLRVGLRQLQLELGLDSVAPDQACMVLAGVMATVAHLARECGLEIGQMRGESLAVLVRDYALGHVERPSQEMEAALEGAHQSDSSTPGQFTPGARLAMLRRNRAQHALEVLQTPVPEGVWEYMEEVVMPPPRERVAWLLAMERPLLVRARVSRVTPQYAELVAFGVQMRARRARSDLRNWMSHPELMWIREVAEVHITGAFVGTGYGGVNWREAVRQALRRDFGLPPSVLHLGVASGILLENLAAGAMAEMRPSQVVDGWYPPRAVWLRAVDRALSFFDAIRVAKAGARVVGYGSGTVRVMVPEGGSEQLALQARNAGVLAGMSVNSAARLVQALEAA